MNRNVTMRNNKETYRIAPMRFNLVLMIIASCMLFAAFVSAYIVHMPDAAAKNTWTKFDLPIQFMFSALVAVLGSLSIYLALRAAKADELVQNRLYLGLTLLLGIVFCFLQYSGWQSMHSIGLVFVNADPEDISASYVYVISFFHVLHVMGGLILLIVTLTKAFKLEVHKKELTLMRVTHTYWHFVGLLWIYLYLFLYFAR
jgi:cytochrome c oxidase subunit 3